MKQVFVKTPQGFVPNCEASQEMFDALPMGTEVMAHHMRKRIYGNHKRFFEFVNRTFDIQDSFDNKELWRKQIQIMAGHYHEVIVPLPDWFDWMIQYLEINLEGKHKDRVIQKLKEAFGLQLWAKSIAYEKMDEHAFREMFTNALNGFLKNYAPDMTDEQFLDILRFE